MIGSPALRLPVGQRSRQDTGRVSLRLPLELRDELVAAARGQGVSLNQFVCAELARAMGRRGVTARERTTARSEPSDPDDDPRWNAWLR